MFSGSVLKAIAESRPYAVRDIPIHTPSEAWEALKSSLNFRGMPDWLEAVPLHYSSYEGAVPEYFVWDLAEASSLSDYVLKGVQSEEVEKVRTLEHVEIRCQPTAIARLLERDRSLPIPWCSALLSKVSIMSLPMADNQDTNCDKWRALLEDLQIDYISCEDGILGVEAVFWLYLTHFTVWKETGRRVVLFIRAVAMLPPPFNQALTEVLTGTYSQQTYSKLFASLDREAPPSLAVVPFADIRREVYKLDRLLRRPVGMLSSSELTRFCKWYDAILSRLPSKLVPPMRTPDEQLTPLLIGNVSSVTPWIRHHFRYSRFDELEKWGVPLAAPAAMQ